MFHIRIEEREYFIFINFQNAIVVIILGRISVADFYHWISRIIKNVGAIPGFDWDITQPDIAYLHNRLRSREPSRSCADFSVHKIEIARTFSINIFIRVVGAVSSRTSSTKVHRNGIAMISPSVVLMEHLVTLKHLVRELFISGPSPLGTEIHERETNIPLIRNNYCGIKFNGVLIVRPIRVI